MLTLQELALKKSHEKMTDLEKRLAAIQSSNAEKEVLMEKVTAHD